jgi:hypothetical protein
MPVKQAAEKRREKRSFLILSVNFSWLNNGPSAERFGAQEPI